mmetsp:Transcript_13458/g.36247  ORF Transcript_13458/g.36247 Transcript_13458/m.36247 type:complete len:365 (+) Transcript_13458:111-1205(+)|eukprot:CAMPEP_0117528696 /NCGR_PEP_ID=MMETSP0784-20121206/37447_1 /TAXON_ID=39447 /ORGANISM="" /LENGTH=364 /DNA_ID=CAMNT_0005324989 /DNA_START=73 /DNA_END=1167 /DNA_ORIENTATION=-
MKGAGAMPGGLSPDAYLDRRLRALDSEHYSAAGFLPYRKHGENGIELLLPRERPWNAITKSYDPLGWNLFCGKRIPRQERAAETTAERCFLEALGKISRPPPQDVLQKAISGSFMIWYPLGKFCLIVADVTDENFDDLPEKFQACRPKDGERPEYCVNELGVRKWIKSIDQLEWLPVARLLPEPEEDLCDLLQNLLKIENFQAFLQGSFDPSIQLPPPRPSDDQSGNSMPYFGGRKGGKSGGKGTSRKGKSFPPWATGGVAMPGTMVKGGFISMPYDMSWKGVVPQQQVNPVHCNKEMQRQMYGEQLYVLVQSHAPSLYVAQKITGMLLELPENELFLTLTDQEELKIRAVEALGVLKEDGVID